MRSLLNIVLVLSVLVAGCSPSQEESAPTGSTGQGQPSWVETVYPEPGATVAVPDAVEVDHSITSDDEDVRLIVDGVDVTTYAILNAGELRYESGEGPVTLRRGEHTAEIQRVTLPVGGADLTVLDSYSWEFRVS